MTKLKTKVKLLDDRARTPTRAHETDTGYDITLIDLKKIEGDVLYFRTGLAIQPPAGYYYEVVPRSSISGLPLELANSVGVIDEHYRGEILVPVRVTHPEMGQDVGRTQFPNGVVRLLGTRPSSLYDVAQAVLSKKPVLFQMILRKRLDSDFEVVVDLEETERGEGGFGSTDAPKEVEGTVTKASTRKGMVKRSADD